MNVTTKPHQKKWTSCRIFGPKFSLVTVPIILPKTCAMMRAPRMAIIVFRVGKKEHSAADTAVAADGSSSLPLSKFTDPDSGVDITVTPHRRNLEPKEEATSKKSRSKDEDGVLDISVIPPWRRKEVTTATVKKPTPTP
mmetsp:Transcript_19931/g.21369  ORF Transcript_19931/g.21369 Transcript_19931/m.21369 type:complete len:139 (-) Transcript_19931:750-1166(-)